MTYRRKRYVSSHAVKALRERFAISATGDRDLGNLLDEAVDVGFRPATVRRIVHKGEECFIVPIDHKFPHLYAAVTESSEGCRFRESIRTVLTRAQVDESIRTGKWDGYYQKSTGPLRASIGDQLRRKA